MSAERPCSVIDTPIQGIRLALQCRGEALAGVEFLPADTPLQGPVGPAATEAVRQIEYYFAGRRKVFQLPLVSDGTLFQRRVWSVLTGIPFGGREYYGALAARLGSGARAVAGACRANPLALVVPCHRVVARAGIGGFMGRSAGDFLAIKQWLLWHEGRIGS